MTRESLLGNPRQRPNKGRAKPWQPGQSGNPVGRPIGSFRSGITDAELKRMVAEGITPLEYLLKVVRATKDSRGNPISMALKIDAAKAAAPYIHKKMPIAIEGGDENKPIRLDATALSKLSTTELVQLRALLSKTGLTEGATSPAAQSSAAGRAIVAVAVQEAQREDGDCDADV